MTLSGDLLAQARQLALLDPRRPKQASLRRAVSTAYYALFHQITTDGANRIVRGASRQSHRALVRRSFEHGRMADVAEDFQRDAVWLRRVGVHPSPALRAVAYAFALLQQQRHIADYGIDTLFTRAQVRELIDLADTAVAQWRTASASPEADYFLLAMLLGRPRRA